eukprot:1130761-Rhodomonas_salina.2
MPDIRARREEVKVRASLPSVVLYVVWGTEVQGCVVLRWGVRCVVREVGGAMCGTEVGNAVCGAEVGYARAERCNDGLVRAYGRVIRQRRARLHAEAVASGKIVPLHLSGHGGTRVPAWDAEDRSRPGSSAEDSEAREESETESMEEEEERTEQSMEEEEEEEEEEDEDEEEDEER